MRFDVPIEIHAHESVQLQEARIDVAQETRIGKRHLGDDVAAEPVDATSLREDVHHRRIHPGIDRAAHQHHGMGDMRVVIGLHARDRGEDRDRRLAHRDDMRVAAEQMQDRDQVVDVIVEIEGALRHRHHPCIGPLGDVDVVIGEEALDRAAQQGRVMPRHRRDDEEARLRPAWRVLEGTLEMQKPTERSLPKHGDVHRDARAADHGGIDIPLRLAISPRRALEQFQARSHGLAEGGIGQRIGGILVEQPCGIGEGAGGIEGRLAHFIEPVGRRRIHRAVGARCGRRAAEFSNRHGPGL